ncbi:MAG: hypothetical protein ACPGPF_06105 [Pontibacterium sp.]
MAIFSKGEFLPIQYVYDVVGLEPHHCAGLLFHIYKSGWANLESTVLPGLVKVYLQGYFPGELIKHKAIKYETDLLTPPSEFDEYTFECYLDPAYAQFGLTPAKKEALFVSSDEDLKQVRFQIKETYSRGAFVLSRPEVGNEAVNVLANNLLDYCHSEGVLGAEQKVRNALENFHRAENKALVCANLPVIEPQHTALSLHPNTSQGLIDLLEANDRFWLYFDREDLTTAPSKKDVIDWLLKKGYSQSLAEKMDTVLRDKRSDPGGRPKTG